MLDGGKGRLLPGLAGHSGLQEQHVQRPRDRKILGIFKEQKEG